MKRYYIIQQTEKTADIYIFGDIVPYEYLDGDVSAKGIVNQIDFYIDYSKMMPVSIIQIECEDFFNEKINHPLVVYLDRCNQYTQKIFKNLGMSFDHRLVPQFKRLVGCELIFDVAWLDEKQSLIVDARLMKCDSRLNDKVVAHLGKLDAPIILDKIDCDLLDPNSLVNQLV